MRSIHLLILAIIFGLFACQPHRDKLTPELQKVIDHYSQSPADSLKLRAAYFLIGNMDVHYTVDSKELRNFYSFIDSVYTIEKPIYWYDSIYKDYLSTHPTIDLKTYPDKDYIKAEYLIKNIDQAFEYHNTPWTKHLTFDQFCEFVLPYRIDDEIIEPWRDLFKKKYQNCFSKADFDTLSAIQACTKLNNKLKVLKNKIHYNPTYIMGMKPSTLANIKFGNCKDYNNLGVYTMRSLGIPIAIDRIPSGHSWNVVLTPTGALDFMAAEQNPGEHLVQYKLWHRIPKVHRQTFFINRQNLVFLCGNEKIPPVFRDPCYIDVTKEYFKGADIEVAILNKSSNNNHYLYLSDFERTAFRIVDWAKIENNKALFINMGDSIIYFPVYYSQVGIKHAAYPILIKKNGTVQEILKPDTKNVENMVLNRKFHINYGWTSFLKRAIGGIFQGANKSDFSDAKNIYHIEKLPEFRMNTLHLSGKSYRYIRYLAPDSSNCNMAEIEVYERGNQTPLKGKILGTDGCFKDSRNCTKVNVFDGNLLTYFDAPKPNGAWVGLDLRTKKNIQTIKYITRNDDNGVRAGEVYELLYMGLDGWISMGIQTAKADSIIFNNVPRNAVYLLKDLTKGKEEQIFTYELGKQVWW